MRRGHGWHGTGEGGQGTRDRGWGGSGAGVSWLCVAQGCGCAAVPLGQAAKCQCMEGTRPHRHDLPKTAGEDDLAQPGRARGAWGCPQPHTPLSHLHPEGLHHYSSQKRGLVPDPGSSAKATSLAVMPRPPRAEPEPCSAHGLFRGSGGASTPLVPAAPRHRVVHGEERRRAGISRDLYCNGN